MAKIDETVFTVQIKAVNTILQLCYTLKDYVDSLIKNTNTNIDDISDLSDKIETINANLNLINSNIQGLNGLYQAQQQQIITNTTNINNLEDNKLDKITSTSYFDKAYVKTTNGTQNMIDMSLDAAPNTIVLRNSTGAINTGTPIYDSHATPKSYVDNNIKLSAIKDINNNNRFIEGVITPNDISGLSYTYSRWSLSGTHLMIVLCFGTTIQTTLTAGTTLCSITLPEWVYNKIYGSYGEKVVSSISTTVRNSVGGGLGDISFRLVKENNALEIRNISNITIDANRYVRCQFDLLIDNS